MREAVQSDAAALAAVQARVWGQVLGPAVAADVSAAWTAEAFVPAWQAALDSARGSGSRHLVALAGHLAVGYATTGPSADPDGDPSCAELELQVDPAHQREGHGSRLLSAAVAGLEAAGLRELRVWALAADTARLAFLSSAGLAPDGARRTLALTIEPSPALDQVRLTALLSASSGHP